MSTEVSPPYHNTNYANFDGNSRIEERHLFDVRNYEAENAAIRGLNEDIGIVSFRRDSNKQVDMEEDQKRDSSREAEDIVPELDAKEVERRQREANEETTRSEDLRLFLQEMHQKCQPIDNAVNSNNIANKSPGSVQRMLTMNIQYNPDSSPCKETIDPSQECDIQAMAAETAPMGPPDGGWAWLVVLASFCCMITIDGACFNYGLLVPDMMDSFQQPNLMPYIWPGSLISGFYMSIGPVASALSNQFDFRPVAIAGALISALAIFLSSFMENLWSFILFFGVFGGIGFGLIYLPAIAIVGHWFHEKRPIAVGLALCGSGCGTLLYGQLIPLLIDIFTWKGTVMLMSAVCVQALVLIALFRPLDLHLRLQQLYKIRSTIRQIHREELKRKRLEYEKKLQEENKPKKVEKDELRYQNRMKNKRIVIYRGSIMQKIIEEKKRQRTVSMGSLDGMVITRDNELIQVEKSSIDLYERPILSMNAINRITESVVKRLENKMQKYGANGVVTTNSTWESKQGGVGTDRDTSDNQIKNSLPQLVQEYINSQLSLPTSKCQSTAANISSSRLLGLQQQTPQGTLSASGREFLVSSPNGNTCSNIESESTSNHSESSSNNQGLALQEEAKAVIQASIRKEITRPCHQKELFFTGSMHQLLNNPANSLSLQEKNRKMSLQAWRSNRSARSSIVTIENTRRSQTSLNMINACDNSVNESGNQSIQEGADTNQLGDESSTQYIEDVNQENYNAQMGDCDGPFKTFMQELLDINLLRSPTFLLMVVSSMISMLGIFVPFFFLPGYITSQQMDLSTAGQLLSYVGIANIAGRILATIYIEKAWSSNYPLADCLWINNFALIVAGCCAGSVPFLINHYTPLLCVLFLYGLCVAGFVSLKSILVVELLGLNRLTNAFGFLLIFQGVATICGPPAAAVLCDTANGRYEVAFYFSGAMIILSGLLCFPLRIVAEREREYLEKRYVNVVPDDENSVGMGSYIDMQNEESCKDQSDPLINNGRTQSANKEGVGEESSQVPEIGNDLILEPVVEEEEELPL